MQARTDLLRQIVGQPRPSDRRDYHSLNPPETGEGAENASLGRWKHAVVRDGEAVGNALEVERRNLVALSAKC